MKKKYVLGFVAAFLITGTAFVIMRFISPSQGKRWPRVYVIGLDGATWDLIEPLIAQGRLPVFKKLRENGSWARLRTFEPTHSAVAWTSIATGKNRFKHGILDWTYVNRQNIRVPYTRSDRRVPSIWEMLDEQKKSSIVLGWFVTDPPDKVDGVVISDSFAPALLSLFSGKGSPQDFAPTVHPRSEFAKLYGELERRRSRGEFGYESLVQEMKIPDYPAEFGKIYRKNPGQVPILGIWSSFLCYNRIEDLLVDHYLAERHYDLFAAYYRFPDVFYHFGTLFLEKNLHDRLDAMLDRKENPTPEILKEFNLRMADVSLPLLKDKEIMLEKIFEKATRENAYLLVCSDHGFRLYSEGYNHYGLNDGAPPPDGILMILGPGVKRNTEIQATIYDIAPTILNLLGLPTGADMDGKPLLEAFVSPRPVSTTVYTRMKHQPGKTDNALDDKKIEELKSLGYIK